MRDRKATMRAVILSALFHLAIVAFLFLAILPCSTYENFFDTLHLPQALNPLTCTPPLKLQGPVIEATLMKVRSNLTSRKGGARLKSHAKPPSTVKPVVKAPLTHKIKTLPPKKLPAVKDQVRVVERGRLKAAEKQEQQEKQRQYQAELKARIARRKVQEMKKLNALFTRMANASRQTHQLIKKARHARQQLAKEIEKKRDDTHKQQSGIQGDHTALLARYVAAIQNAVTPNWLRPAHMLYVQCKVHIIQLPGGKVISATVDSDCPYDTVGRRSIENAVLRTTTLPYKGFERVFSRHLTLTFTPQ